MRRVIISPPKVVIENDLPLGYGYEAVIIAIIAAAATTTAAIISAQNAKRAGEAQQEAYDYNAEVINTEAEETGKKYEAAELQHRDKVRRLLATQRALYAKAGVDLTSGSPLAVLGETAEEGEEASLALRHEGAVEVTRLRNQAQLSRYYGENAAITGRNTAQTTLLSGLGQAGMSFAMASKGMWGRGTSSTKTIITEPG